MPYLEKDFQSDFGAWLRNKKRETLLTQEGENQFFWTTMALEYKCIPKGKRLNFKSGFEPQQITKLYESKHGCVYKKLSDLDPSLKPYDAFQICYARAYLVVMWYEQKRPKVVYFIDIDSLIKEIESTKSLSEERAGQICDRQVVI